MTKNKSNQERRDQKREKFAASKRTGPPPLLAIVAAVVVVTLVGMAAFVILRSEPAGVASQATAVAAGNPTPAVPAIASSTQPGDFVTVSAVNGEVRLPASTFSDGKARFYTYQNGSQIIEFFVLKSNDGIIRAAFNACDVCYPARKGYRQEGDEMVCNNCGRRFASTRINEVKGGCNPAPLERAVVGDELVIKVENILTGIRYF